jgi:hypothetical protein
MRAELDAGAFFCAFTLASAKPKKERETVLKKNHDKKRKHRVQKKTA